jgi:tetratricopeptide (TPR) repeat protein
MVGLAVASLAFPRAADAQGEPFFRALTELHAALEGVYGDEGQEVPRRLDELAAALAAWDGSTREIELTLRPRLERASPDEAAGIHETLGSAYLRRSRFADALAELDEASRIAPRRARIHLLRAAALEALGRTGEAASAYRQAWSMEPDDPAAAYLALTRAVIDGADLERIRGTLLETGRKAIRGPWQPPSAPFIAHLAQVPFFSPAVPGSGGDGGAPVFAPARYADGFALHAEGRHEEAIARLREAAAADPLIADQASRTDRWRQAVGALRQGSLAAAITALEAIVRAYPGSSEARRVLGTALALAGDLERSATHLEAALRIRPDDERSWIALARVRADAGALDEAFGSLAKAVAAVPRSGELRWRLAGLAVRLKRDEVALDQYGEAARLAVMSGQPQVEHALAAAASLHQDVARTVEAAERRVRLDPNGAAAHRDLAAVYVKQGRLDEALAELAIAVWLDPGDPFAVLGLGHAHLAARRDQDAVDAFERAAALEPELPAARYALAQALTRLGRRGEGRRHLAEFERLRDQANERGRREDEIAAIKGEAVAQSRAGRYRQAAETWRKAIALEPGVAQNYRELAEVLVRAGLLEMSLEYFVRTAELDGVAEVHLRLSDVLARLGRARESVLARETYERLRLEDFRRRAWR